MPKKEPIQQFLEMNLPKTVDANAEYWALWISIVGLVKMQLPYLFYSAIF